MDIVIEYCKIKDTGRKNYPQLELISELYIQINFVEFILNSLCQFCQFFTPSFCLYVSEFSDPHHSIVIIFVNSYYSLLLAQ